MSLNQDVLIPTDGSGRILITDIGHSSNNALSCSSLELGVQGGYWYLHPTNKTTADIYKITSSGTPDRGWREIERDHEISLWRASDTPAEEGVFTCNLLGDNNPPVSVGIYYHSKSISAEIEIVNAIQFNLSTSTIGVCHH